MHIKEIVLDNFKSFGRKTRIPFYDDFTTVSGPNGSGKSNIIDSVLFALGLARTRGIRAEKLTDLIYNPGHVDGDGGSGPREANVEVILDNSDGTLERPQIVNAAGTDDIGDAATISIKRRVKRTEENYYSYYYLNGRSVNLSDIRDLLAQAGVKPEGYNVVMQGDVTGIINMTPFQRRTIIDEIAGVAEFDEKRDAAAEELETVRERIGEAELRIEEKEERLDRLADERETALEYQGLREEKAMYEGYLKAAELEEKRGDLEATVADLETRRSELDERRRELDEHQGRVVRLQEDLEDLNLEIERKGEDEQLEIKREIEEIKGEIGRYRDRIATAEERIDEATKDKREAFVKLDQTEEQIAEYETQIKETKLQKVSIKSDIQERERERDAVQAEIEEIGTEYDELRAKLEAKKDDLEAVRDEKNEYQREQDRLLDEARRRSNRLDEIAAEREQADDRLSELDDQLRDLEDERVKARQNHEQIDAVLDDLRERKGELKGDLERVEDELQAKRQEYAQLEAERENGGEPSFGRAVTTVLNAGFDGVHGTVAQLGGVEDQYAVACETAAGGRMANVVVDDEQVGQRCIEHLKSRGAGRATFLPITKMDVRSPPSLPSHDGVIDFAFNLVEFDDRYEGIFSYVLGDTLVVDTLDTARELMGRYRLVTLDGDLVERSGAMTGGSRSGSRYSFSKSGKGQLERVAEAIDAIQDEQESIREDLRELQGRIDDARDRRSDAAETLREVDAEIDRTERERGEVQDRLDRLDDEREELESKRESADTEMQELEAKIADADDRIEGIRAAIEELEGELADSKIPELTEKRDAIEAEIDELEDRTDDLDATMNELALEKGYAEKNADELEETIENAESTVEEQRTAIEEYRESIEGLEARLAEKHEAVEAIEAELVDLKADREELRETLREATEERDEKANAVAEVENRVESLENARDRLREEIAELEEEVDDYDPDEIPDHATVRRNIDRLERQMSALEPVNMLAIDEYESVESELDTLTERKEVLDEERREIIDRIDSYEQQKRETFMDAYEGIDEHFQEIFERLSNGTGTLHLENEEDPFEGGLTMRAQPGDKPIQRLDAMSGGEKSLTALAFVFAIQRYNPAPFYALDEIDAFLDAANAERVGEMVDELADNAQFIVVSHRSAMLERSERAIGVTMQDENVSAVTGIDIGGDDREEVPVDA